MRKRPAGADNFLKWRRSIAEHLELRRMTWHEFGMFAWLCTKASGQTGIVRTSWPTLADETGLSVNHVEQVCRALKRKRYVWYAPHPGTRRRLVEVAIDKYPTADGGYTDLSSRFRAGTARRPSAGPTAGSTEAPMEVPTDVPTEVPTDVLTQVRAERIEYSRGLPPGRRRRRKDREREQDGECARARDRRNGRDQEQARGRIDGRAHTDGRGPAPAWREELTTPVAIGELLAAQPWWRPRAADRASAHGAAAGGTSDGSRATVARGHPPGGASR